MSDERTYTAKDLDAAFGPGASAHAARLFEESEAPKILGRAIDAAKVFYHLYVCPLTACLKAANPSPGSWHQRGLHLASETPRTDVKCPGCGNPMVIGRDGLDAKGVPLVEGQLTEDKDGNAVLHGRPIIQEAPGQPDQTAELEDANRETNEP